MKKYLLFIVFIALICRIVTTNKAQATCYFLGTDLTWKCIGKDSFIIKLSYYRDCNGISVSGVPIHIKCKNTGTLLMSKSINVPSPVDITPVCENSCTRCQSNSCSFPYGIEQYSFQTLVVLSSAGSCCEISLEYSEPYRFANITTGAAWESYLNYAILNRCLTAVDNSPDFTIPPLAIICIGQNFVYNPGVQDIDTDSNGGLVDSLTYEWAYPLNSAGANIGYISGYDYNKPIFFWGFPYSTQPFPRGFHLDPLTGDISFRPQKIEMTVMVLKVNEFRNGIKIGEVRRDMIVMVINCPHNLSPSLSPAIYYKEVCAGNTVSFNINTYDSDSNSTLTISWNKGISGASWSDNNGTTKRPTGVFSWTPDEHQVSNNAYQFTVTVKDNICPTQGSFTRAYRVLVKPYGKANYMVADSSCGNYYFRAEAVTGHWPDTFTWNSPNIKFSSPHSAILKQKIYPGIYPYSLKASYKGCSTTYLDTLVVDSILPVARLLINQPNQCLKGNSFSFSDASFIGKGSISSNAIYFGDGQFSTQKSVIHSYSKVGKYKVKLQVTDANGCSDSVIQYVNVLPHPKAGFSINSDKQCLGDNKFGLLDSTITYGIPVHQYGWNTGDLSVFIAKDSQYIYKNPGTYQLTHWAINDSGCADTVSRTVIVHPSPTASFTVNDSSQCLEDNYFVFTNLSTVSSGTLSANWNMGDGLGSSGKFDTSYTYLHDGNFNVNLKITSDKGCKDSAFRSLIVHPMPTASFSINDNSQCFDGNHFVFTNLSSISSGNMSAHWKMGDGLGSFVKFNTSYNYLQDGIYKVNLIITSDKGCKDSTSHNMVVYPMPVADFEINDSSQCQNGNSFVFTNKSILKSGALYSIWNFGDNNYDTAFSPVHSYSAANIFPVKLIVFSAQYCKDSITKNVEVISNPVTNLGKDITLYDTGSIILDAGSGFDSYLWSNSKTTSAITVDTAGIGLGTKLFWVKVKKDDCEGFDSVLITFIHYVSINDPILDQFIRVYPNPASTVLNIALSGLTEVVVLVLTDVYGKQVKWLKINEANSSGIQKINISDLANGVYYLSVSVGGKISYLKLIKN